MKLHEPGSDIDLVVPTYNSQRFILESIKEIEAYRELFGRVIFVDDGSTDETANLLHSSNKVERINLPSNKGQHHATRVGLSASSASYVMTLDDDLPVSLSEIEKLILTAKKHHPDLVYGSYNVPGKSFLEKLGSRLVYRIMSRKYKLRQEGSSTRVIHRSLIDRLENNYSAFLDHCLLEHAKRVEFVTLQAKEKTERSRYTIGGRIHLFIKMLLRK